MVTENVVKIVSLDARGNARQQIKTLNLTCKNLLCAGHFARHSLQGKVIGHFGSDKSHKKKLVLRTYKQYYPVSTKCTLDIYWYIYQIIWKNKHQTDSCGCNLGWEVV